MFIDETYIMMCRIALTKKVTIGESRGKSTKCSTSYMKKNQDSLVTHDDKSTDTTVTDYLHDLFGYGELPVNKSTLSAL